MKMKIMLKNNIELVEKKGIKYQKINGKKKKYKPWIGDIFSPFYDFLMIKSLFPKKFNASFRKNTEILKKEFKDVHNKHILELATGSGNMADILPKDNFYSGIDISENLLRQAEKKFKHFRNADFYVATAENLPFENNLFDICICNLSLNFFSDLDEVIKEIIRILKPNSIFVCSIPVPEKNKENNKIRGNLFTEEELIKKFHNFKFERIDENGALLYFRAVLKSNM